MMGLGSLQARSAAERSDIVTFRAAGREYDWTTQRMTVTQMHLHVYRSKGILVCVSVFVCVVRVCVFVTVLTLHMCLSDKGNDREKERVLHF
jgi:hypothetical protein